MKVVILSILFAVLIILLLLICTIFFIYFKLKKVAYEAGFVNMNSISALKYGYNELKRENSEIKRSVSGMTSILLPQIIKDFPEFNENYIYNKTRDSLNIIFNALNNLDDKNLNKIFLLKDSIKNTIQDYKNNDIIVKYSDIIFHDFAIKDYSKIDGVATVTVCSTLEYYFNKSKNNITIYKDRYKKQTRYACKFIYIYDEHKLKSSSKIMGLNCPNCGAAIKVLGHKYCEYCATEIKDINLRTWEFSSYNEY